MSTTVERPAPSGSSLVPSKPRVGDRVFKGLSTGAGVLIFVILGAVATFLLAMAFPALVATPAELEERGFGEFWSWVIPLAFGTVWSSFWALVFAVPVAIGIALFISHYAPRRLAATLGYVIDLLAAVPSVVYGLWGGIALAGALQPLHAWLTTYLGWIPIFAGPASGTGRTLLTTSLVLAVMILPIITSLCREVFLQTPKLHEEAALALGATRWEMVRMAVFPFARAGIVSAIMLGLGRALGETMAVAMVLSGANVIKLEMLTQQNPISIAARIALDFPESSGIAVNQLIAAGLVLFVITLAVNMVARWIVARRAAFSGAN
ncbi:phosphate ABC transporter permease subunit PstC [Propioniciclava sp. MC1595]|uniref:phosphate ABC transporter permease subunit PstC n=1 Tax=unclassified Propioniciclava TaxID=2642922 RepID=UPI0015FFBC3E|nr:MULTISPECIES: phosphate ABC transporter permease subunit PstC [unclassified Propioniciclava]MBB1494993.1 phosphate ABC transporter permease subunit PstC [Propioniciclava sp. MC1595]MBB1501305.1 phosphate ABC transporter permease subunit PstC [Propioniciclava sp. MC1683]QTE25610.1 phosphate ABC transporter permease subunit PstC [Propioniciclava sp. MC1595]